MIKELKVRGGDLYMDADIHKNTKIDLAYELGDNRQVKKSKINCYQYKR